MTSEDMSFRSALADAQRPTLICDCEGAEDILLRPDQVESLARSLIIVETHDGLKTKDGVLSGITGRLHERFSPTHEIEVVASRPRNRADLPGDCSVLTNEEAVEAVNEGRPWPQWLFLRPRASIIPA
jgi:hypothetical protein